MSVVGLLLPHVPAILELVQRTLADSERSEAALKLGVGLVGDLAEVFPNGEIKQFLVAEWVASELRTRGRFSPETKRTIRWARDVRGSVLSMCEPTDFCSTRRSSGPPFRRPSLVLSSATKLFSFSLYLIV